MERKGPAARLASLRATVRELGLVNALLYWTDRMLAGLSGGRARLMAYLLVVQPLPQRLVPPERARNIAVRPLTLADVGRYTFPVPSHVIERRLNAGSMCLLAEIGDELAGYLWLHCGPYLEDEVRCVFLPQPAAETAWDFDVYVEPRYRITRVFARLWDEGSTLLRARGYKSTASRISAFNPASLRSHARLGGRIVGKLVFVTVGDLQMLVAGRFPFLHITGASSRPPQVQVP